MKLTGETCATCQGQIVRDGADDDHCLQCNRPVRREEPLQRPEGRQRERGPRYLDSAERARREIEELMQE